MRIVRLRVGDDLAPATELLLRFFAEEGFTTDQATIAANVRTLAGLETCALFVAEADGACVGVATVSLEFGVEFGWWAEMGDLYVIPEARGRGVSLAHVAAIIPRLHYIPCRRPLLTSIHSEIAPAPTKDHMRYTDR